MEIIGATKYSLIVEMSPEELGMLVPNVHVASLPHHDLHHMTGREFAIGKAWARLKPILDNRKKLETIAGQFKAMGELLEPIIAEVEEQTGGEYKKEDPFA